MGSHLRSHPGQQRLPGRPAAARSLYRRGRAKQLLYAILSGSPPEGEQRRSISTVRSVFAELRRLLIWLDGRDAAALRPGLAGITAADLADYQRHLIAVGLPEGARRFAQGSVGYLWRYRHALPPDEQLRFDPRRLEGLDKPKARDPENGTERIPEAVLGPLLAWSMRFTTDFAPDILSCCRQWHKERKEEAGFRGRVTAAEARQLLADRAARRQPLPGRDGKVNILALTKRLGCSRDVLAGLASEIDQATAAAGITPWACYELPVSELLDGQPWISGIATHPRNLRPISWPSSQTSPQPQPRPLDPGIRGALGGVLRHPGSCPGKGRRLDRGLQHLPSALRLPDDVPGRLREGANGPARGILTCSRFSLPPGCAGARPSPARSSSPGLPARPAGTPPGQGLRSGGLIGQGRTGPKQDPHTKVSTVPGEPRYLARQ